MKKNCISVVAPVYNEEKTIKRFSQRVLSVLDRMDLKKFELILVNDGSKDQSSNKLDSIEKNNSNVRVINLYRNYGQTAALQCGIDNARFEIIVTMDSDLQHFPEEIPSFLDKLNKGFDIVCGWRMARSESILRRWPSRIANLVIRLITGIHLHDFGTTFRAYRAEIIKDIRLYGEFHRFVPVIGHIAGCRICEIPIKNISRAKGKSNYGISRTLGVLLDLITLIFFVKYMDRPMRLFGLVGAIMAITGISVIALLVILSMVYGVSLVKERLGWFMLSILFIIGALQAIFTGIIAEVLIRIRYEQGNDRVYKINKKI